MSAINDATRGKHWVTDPTSFLEPKIGKDGQAATKPTTIVEVFQDTIKKHGSKPALHLKRTVNVRDYMGASICFEYYYI